MRTIFLLVLFAQLAFKGLTQYYPPPACVHYNDGSLTVCPPDSVPAYTGGLLGYNIYVNDIYNAFIPQTNPADSVVYTFDPLPEPGTNAFCAKTIYQAWMSDPACDTAFLRYGHPLPFFEGWDSQSFDTNTWSAEDDAWTISLDEGSPFPSAAFSGQAGLTNYSRTLTSFPFLGDSLLHGSFYVEFDLKLNSLSPTGDEVLRVQAWDWTSREWEDIMTPFSNENGSFEWMHQRVNIASQVKAKVFRIRFVAEGIQSGDITGWYVDNVMVQRTCFAPDELVTMINQDNQIELFWTSANCGNYPFPISHITYGLYTSIGTGQEVAFDVAARWSPAMLEGVNYIYSVNFVPCESDAAYAIRIWQGDTAALVYEQPVDGFTLEAWNNVVLDPPCPVDHNQMLWIGYHIEANTGYPAGVDNGPAYDGWGNMMFWEGEWSTLLEVNPELDYNWNIVAHAAPQYWYCGNRVYRKVNDGDYELIADINMLGHYLDEEADPGDLNCYRVTDVRAYQGDTCESAFSEESCTLPVGMGEYPAEDRILMYPNPAVDQVTIVSPDLLDKVQVVDLTGRLILQQEPGAMSVNILAENIPQGIYLVRIYSEEKVITRKVLVIRQ